MLHAVTYLHQQDVWHRDLKSSNVLMSHMYGQRIIKVRAAVHAFARRLSVTATVSSWPLSSGIACRTCKPCCMTVTADSVVDGCFGWVPAVFYRSQRTDPAGQHQAECLASCADRGPGLRTLSHSGGLPLRRAAGAGPGQHSSAALAMTTFTNLTLPQLKPCVVAVNRHALQP